MLELADVTKVFNQGRPNEVVAVRDVSLAIMPGQVTVLTGPSGSGKTTLMTLIGCLARPTSGRVTLDGEMLSGLPEQFLAAMRRKTFGFAFQHFNLIPGLTAFENIILPAYPLGPPYAALKAQAETLLDDLAIGHRAGLAVENLSGGEMQRVAIARALINDPRIVIADEPTANLDSVLVDQFLTIIARLKSQGRTVLMTSHDSRITAAPIVDRVVAMADGGILTDSASDGGASAAPAVTP